MTHTEHFHKALEMYVETEIKMNECPAAHDEVHCVFKKNNVVFIKKTF